MLADLFAGAFERYVAGLRGDALWLFVHVPKTAGSSLTNEAASILQPAYNIEIDHTDTTRTYQERFDSAVEKFIALHRERQFRFASGHIVVRHVGSIRKAFPATRFFTMMRDPIKRLISDYRYQRSAMNLARAAFIANTPSFEAYVARPHVHNKMAISLVPRPLVIAGDVPACVAHIMREYAFVGLQETYPLSLRLLTTLMGDARMPAARVRVNTAQEDQVVLTPEQERSLRALNSVDIALFEEFDARWRGISDGVREYLKLPPVAA